jgi:hypothetical protein
VCIANRTNCGTWTPNGSGVADLFLRRCPYWEATSCSRPAWPYWSVPAVAGVGAPDSASGRTRSARSSPQPHPCFRKAAEGRACLGRDESQFEVLEEYDANRGLRRTFPGSSVRHG